MGRTLEDEFEEEELALSTRKTCHELTGDGPAHNDGLVLLLSDIRFPVGKLLVVEKERERDDGKNNHNERDRK